jgi:polyisoprenoid-binding protein YceI
MRRILFLVTLSVLWVAFAFSPSEKHTWKIDKKYAVKFFNKSVGGEFLSFKGEVIFNPEDLNGNRFNLSVDPLSVNTGNKMQNGHIQNKEWLDSKAFPTIDFISSSFEKQGENYTVFGEMNMHGVKRKMKIPFTYLADGKKKGLIKSTFSFNRFDFNIGSPGDGVDSVMTIEVTMPLKK